MKKRIIILANGTPPAKRLFHRYYQKGDVLVCVDGGANTAAKLSLRPDVILGDMDSVTPQTLKRFRSVPRKQILEQESTDLEKGFAYAAAHRCSEVLVFGATGGRADHEFSNVSALAKFSPFLNIVFVDRYGEYVFLERKTVLRVPCGTTISFLPLTICKGVTTSGLQWNLTNDVLGLGVRDSTRNISIAESVSIRFRTGSLVVFIARSSFNRKSLNHQIIKSLNHQPIVL